MFGNLIVFLICMIRKLYTKMAAILDAILDFEECQQGISGDFLSVILHIFLDLSWKNQLVIKNVQVKPNIIGLCFVIPRGLSTLYRCSLTTVAQDKPYHEKPFIRDCFNHKGSCTLFRPYLTIAAGISSSSFVRVSTRQLAVSSLSKGISSTLNFHERIGTDGTRTRNLSHPKRAPYRLS